MSVRSSAIGLAAVVILMGAGAAQSLSGSNTVFTDDIVDGAVTTPDIRANAVSSSRIIDGGVFGPDLANNAVTGSKVAGDSLTGSDINESTLDFKSVLSVRVSSAGAHVTGFADATGAIRNALGDYTVSFGRDVSLCRIHVTPQGFSGGGTFVPASFATSTVGGIGSTTVNVKVFSPAAAVDSSFTLTAIAC